MAFGYRVVAKRKDIPGPRLERVEVPDFERALEAVRQSGVPVPTAPTGPATSSGTTQQQPASAPTPRPGGSPTPTVQGVR